MCKVKCCQMLSENLWHQTLVCSVVGAVTEHAVSVVVTISDVILVFIC